MKKYKNIRYFTHGQTFIYFQAQEQSSELDVMIMVLKSSEIKNYIGKDKEKDKDKGFLNKIAQLKHRNLIQLLDVNEKMATLQQGEINPYSEYEVFLTAFIKTIEKHDPRWHSKDVKKAWDTVKETVLTQLKNAAPEPETVSNHLPNPPLSTLKANEKQSVVENQATKNDVPSPENEEETEFNGTTKVDTAYNVIEDSERA
jgi:hypothetical protein